MINEESRVAVVTGASSGIGKSTARMLAAQGWRVIGLGRDPQRCAAAEQEIRAAAAPGVEVDMIRTDLALMSGAARAADEVLARTDRIDALINNAGGVAKEKVVTAEGLEATFTGNHLGHFLLTDRLLPLLRAAAVKPGAARIISVSSRAHELCPGMNWDDLQHMRDFQAVPAYASAKLANILFTRALAKRLADDGIVAHAMHPGVVDSNFFSHGDEFMQNYAVTRKADLVTPDQPAETLVWLASADQAGQSSGGYYFNCAPAACSAAAQDEAAAERLWTDSAALISGLC